MAGWKLWSESTTELEKLCAGKLQTPNTILLLLEKENDNSYLKISESV